MASWFPYCANGSRLLGRTLRNDDSETSRCCTCSGGAVGVDDQVGSMAIDLLETACCPSSRLVISGVDPGDVVI